jgi:hypothetical protein
MMSRDGDMEDEGLVVGEGVASDEPGARKYGELMNLMLQ